jgi:hypothetical protein
MYQFMGSMSSSRTAAPKAPLNAINWKTGMMSDGMNADGIRRTRRRVRFTKAPTT